jgi:hypothetical protein
MSDTRCKHCNRRIIRIGLTEWGHVPTTPRESLSRQCRPPAARRTANPAGGSRHA